MKVQTHRGLVITTWKQQKEPREKKWRQLLFVIGVKVLYKYTKLLKDYAATFFEYRLWFLFFLFLFFIFFFLISVFFLFTITFNFLIFYCMYFLIVLQRDVGWNRETDSIEFFCDYNITSEWKKTAIPCDFLCCVPRYMYSIDCVGTRLSG